MAGPPAGTNYWVQTDARGRARAFFTLDEKFDDSQRALLYAVGRVLRREFAGNIDAGGRPTFAPLAKRTLQQKARLGYPATPLIRTRLLRNSLAQRNVTGNVTYITSKGRLVVGSSLRYAAVHQDGGGNGIPARPFLVVSDAAWAQIGGLVADWREKRARTAINEA